VASLENLGLKRYTLRIELSQLLSFLRSEYGVFAGIESAEL